jgi:hypothetical protein
MKVMASKKQNMFVHDGNMYTKQEYALMLWGMKVKELGLESADRACALYAAANNRVLTAQEKKAVANGFAYNTQE